MKRSIIAFLCVFVSVIQPAAAQTDSEILQNKLAKVTLIDTDFIQQVFNSEGKLLQESAGKLVISRPGNFRWQVKTPEENLIISNGKTIWSYDPFIEQVTIMNFKDAVAGTAFILLSGAESTQWEKFDVKKSGNEFVVSNNTDKTNTNQFTFVFDKTDNISQFRVVEKQGQKSVFKLTPNTINKSLSNDFFEFKIPVGIEIDDQR